MKLILVLAKDETPEVGTPWVAKLAEAEDAEQMREASLIVVDWVDIADKAELLTRAGKAYDLLDSIKGVIRVVETP